MLDGCLQTKNRFMAVHCYMLSVKILTSLSELLLSQILKAQDGHPTGASPTGWYQFNSPSSRGSIRSDKSSSAEIIPTFHSNLHIGELFSHLNPFMHALSSACTTLRVSLRLLREDEVALAIVRTDINTPDTTSSSRLDEEPVQTLASRLVSVLWGDEVGEDEAKSSSQGKTLAVLRRCYREIFYLAKEHNIAFYFDYTRTMEPC